MSAAEAVPGPRRAVVVDATRATMPGAAMRVAGLTTTERAIKQWARQRDVDLVVVADGAVPLPATLPAGVAVERTSPGGAGGTFRDTSSDGAVASHGAVARDGAVAGGGDAAAVIAARLGAAAADIVPANRVDPAGRPGSGGAPVLVVDAASRRRAEDAVFAELLRGDLGLVARRVNKPLSFRITRHLLCGLAVTPNQVTVLAGLLGLVGAALIASGRWAAAVAGYALAQLQSVLDGCDGELARVRFQQSAIGEWLDTVVDDVLNLALLAALAMALREPARRGIVGALLGPWGGWLPALGAAAAAMLLTYNVVAYAELARQGEGGEVLKVRWWFGGGADAKALAARGARGATGLLYSIGRRDFFVLAWLALALLDQLGLVLVYALFIAGTSFTVAVGQLLWRLRGGGGGAADAERAALK